MAAPASVSGAAFTGTAPEVASGAGRDRVVVAAFMVATIASGVAGGAGYDTARDVAQALAIRHLDALPLHGPIFAGTVHFGPLWFYLLALPLVVHQSWLAVALFVPALGSLQFPLAYAAGCRLLDRRLGMLWCALLALPGWGSFQLAGFSHTNLVPACTMLVLYALVRLAQERRPVWMVTAAGALSLAAHAHPTTMALLPVAAVVALHALRDAGSLVRWGAVSLAVAALPFAPLAFEHLVAPSTLLQNAGQYVEGMVRIENVADVPALLYGVLVRGPRVVAAAFFGWAPGLPLALWAATAVIEFAAGAGIVMALVRHRALAAVGLVVAGSVAIAIAWMRPVTPFYMTYALLPPLAGIGALGLHTLGARFGPAAGSIAAGWVGVLLALQVATVGGIAQATTSGHVTMAVASRLDVKRDDAAAPLAEPWLPAYAVDASGALLCAQPHPVVLHGTYAFLQDVYLGLDHRLRCGPRDIRLIGAMPAGATHLAGLAQPLWTALRWRPQIVIGGLGVSPAARVLGPAAGFAVPDGATYPPHRIPAGPDRTVQIEASIPRHEALVVSLPYATWMPAPIVRVTADGEPQLALARDAVSAVYACRNCGAAAAVTWRIEIESVAPERVDIVTLASPAER